MGLSLTPDRLAGTAREVAKVVDVMPLESPQEAEQAALMLRTLHTIRAEAEAARKAEKAPHLAAGREVDERFKPGLNELDRVMRLIKERLAERSLRMEAAKQEALLEKDASKANAALANVEEAPTEERWTWEVESFDLTKVPVEYLLLNEAAVRSLIKGCDKLAKEPTLEGVKFKRKVVVVARKL